MGTSTVSRYFRGVTIKPDAAQRVKRAAEELGYEPDQMAVALRSGRTGTIGVVMPQVANAFFSQAVQVVQQEASMRGSAVILLTHEEDPARLERELLTLKRYRVDGVLLTTTPGTPPVSLHKFCKTMKVVAFDRSIGEETDAVILRNRESACVATEHLLRHGYGSIACLTAKPEIYTFAQRLQGYRDTVLAAGQRPWEVHAGDYDELRYAIGSLLSQRVRPEALLTLSNMATVSLLRAYSELDLPENQRLPFIGFDDLEFGSLVNPPLTVMRQPVESMVRYALNMLFRRIESEDIAGVQTVSLPAELVVRRSCGCQ